MPRTRQKSTVSTRRRSARRQTSNDEETTVLEIESTSVLEIDSDNEPVTIASKRRHAHGKKGRKAGKKGKRGRKASQASRGRKTGKRARVESSDESSDESDSVASDKSTKSTHSDSTSDTGSSYYNEDLHGHYAIVDDPTSSGSDTLSVVVVDLARKNPCVIHLDDRKALRNFLPSSYKSNTTMFTIACYHLAEAVKAGEITVKEISISRERPVQVVRNLLKEWSRNNWSNVNNEYIPCLKTLYDTSRSYKWKVRELKRSEKSEIDDLLTKTIHA